MKICPEKIRLSREVSISYMETERIVFIRGWKSSSGEIMQLLINCSITRNERGVSGCEVDTQENQATVEITQN